MRQAWYRCREWLDGEDGRRHQRTSIRSRCPTPACRTEEVPARGPRASPFPTRPSIANQSWNERDILGWFDEHDARVLRAARNLAHSGAPRRRSSGAPAGGRGPIGRTARPGRARASASGGVSRRRRGGGCREMKRPLAHGPDDAGSDGPAPPLPGSQTPRTPPRQARRAAAAGVAVSRPLCAGAQRRRRAARDRRRLQLQPATHGGARTGRLRAGERGAAPGRRAEAPTGPSTTWSPAR